MRNYRAKDVDAYIAGSGKEARPTLKELRKVITSAIPKAEEGISWGIPFYKYHGLLAGFAAFKNHAGFGFASALPNKDRKALEKKGYTTGSKTVQIRFDQKVPATVIQRMLKAKAKANKASAD
ncbi:TPA: DUF1801 domain-containing protein [Candidatus Kaiserbacteria bacterium]|nr:MAG: hypothetical protein UY93_C0002G0328 [Parcubacteria group bacterium GW2011_GWA1_56_13]KKW46240.1 MAG: hypothetical protein UY97_C0008G0027 [Parcubacteria group bacterium GW2011_GWB1_57_6]HCR52690.1 DUF1801 domain-containing protein [Candidatus Kaiserbacteria bacterium]